MNKVTLIADNGGGMTLQIVDADNRYQHYYDHVTIQTAEDVLAAISNSDFTEWDNNEADDWLVPSQSELSSGGYNVIEADCYHTVLEWGVNSSWSNVIEITDMLDNLINSVIDDSMGNSHQLANSLQR